MFKMAETNNRYINLPNQQKKQLRLNEIIEIMYHLFAEIKERYLISKKLIFTN